MPSSVAVTHTLPWGPIPRSSGATSTLANIGNDDADRVGGQSSRLAVRGRCCPADGVSGFDTLGELRAPPLCDELAEVHPQNVVTVRIDPTAITRRINESKRIRETAKGYGSTLTL